MTVKEINEARKKFKTQIEENNMKMKKNKHIKSQSTISKNKTNINLKNIHNFEDSKINIIDDLNLNIKMNVKTNRIPFRKNDITFNKNLSKLGNKKENLERYKEIEDANKNKNVELILNERKKEKEEKHRQIKEVLIEAVRLKTKLKSQLDDLKSNIKIDEKVVLEHLMRAGMDIPQLSSYRDNDLKNKKSSGKKKGK